MKNMTEEKENNKEHNNSYKDVVRFLEEQQDSHDPEYLRKIREKLQLSTNPERVIVVAGTNGKGTTSATIAALLHAAGMHVGFYSSPHLVSTTERIKYDAADISEEDFCAVFEAVREMVREMVGEVSLSHFEWLTLMAEYYFFEVKRADYAIFEVGMGGIFDATNAISHKFCVITRLALDHCDVLGDSLEEIARNKFGIISDGSVVFHTTFPNESVEQIAKEYAEKHGAKLVESCDFEMEVDQSKRYPTFFVRTPFGRFQMSLPGKRAAENSALALTFLDYFMHTGGYHHDLAAYAPTISKINWPGRMQLVKYRGRDVFLSGDHNPNGIQSLLDLLQYYRSENNFRKIHFVIGIGSTKDHHNMLEMLFAVPNSRIYFTETPVHTLPINQYDAADLTRASCATSDPKEALDAAVSQAAPDDMVIVTGSLYLVGRILGIVV